MLALQTLLLDLLISPIAVSSLPSTTFAELLVTVPPRERSGARSSNRFSFQHSWGLGLLLQLHAKPDDYCVLFDIHEDVVALDSVNVPTIADVFQIKSETTRSWTVSSLTKREKHKTTKVEKPSILGKLYNSYVQFPGFIKSMSFVTNASFSLRLADGTSCNEHESISINQIEATEQAKIKTKIAEEHGVTDPPAGMESVFLVTTSLSVTDHERHTEGIVSAFLQTQGDGTIQPAPFHRTLRSEVRRRNDKETSATTFADLARAKGLSRADFQRMLDSIPSDLRIAELHALVRNQLIKEGADLRLQAAMNAEVRNYLAKRLDETNAVLVDARERAAREVKLLPDAVFASPTPLTNVIAQLNVIVAQEFDAIRLNYSDSFLKAIIAVAVYEQHEFPPSGA